MTKIILVKGDITSAETDIIVNSAKPSLTGGSGVDGAIHRVAGPSVLKECLSIKSTDGVRCPTGNAVLTGAGELKAQYIIHTVGPIYSSDKQPERSLTSAYENCLKLALENNCTSIAFPAISCGKYGYPYLEAAKIAVKICNDYLKFGLQIYFYLLEEDLYSIFTDQVSGRQP